MPVVLAPTRRPFPMLLVAVVALAGAAPAPKAEPPAPSTEIAGGAYAIGGIAVDVSAKTPEDARIAGYRIAQRKAWPLLWARLTGQGEASAPHLSDSQLDSIVAGIESEGERFSMTRYIAKLGVVFDRARASDYFGGIAGTLQSPPMLLLVVTNDGGARTLYQSKTPWRSAWQRFGGSASTIDYVVPSGSAADNIQLTAWQVSRPDRPTWRNILNRFDAVDVLTAEVRLTRSWPGGPVSALFIARHGPDGTELGRFSLSSADEAGLDAMLDTGVRDMDTVFATALRDGRLRAEADLSVDLNAAVAPPPMIGAVFEGAGDVEGGDAAAAAASDEISMATPDVATATQLENALRGTPGVTGVTITSLSLGGTTRALVSYSGSREALALALDSRGLRLLTENGIAVLRRRREGEAALPRPEPVRPEVPRPEALRPDGKGDRPAGDQSLPATATPDNLLPEPVSSPRKSRAEPRAEPRAEAPAKGRGPVDLLPDPAEQPAAKPPARPARPGAL